MNQLTSIINGNTTLSEAIAKARNLGAGCVKFVQYNQRNEPIAAIIVVQGEEAKTVVQQVDAIENSWTDDEENEGLDYGSCEAIQAS